MSVFLLALIACQPNATTVEPIPTAESEVVETRSNATVCLFANVGTAFGGGGDLESFCETVPNVIRGPSGEAGFHPGEKDLLIEALLTTLDQDGSGVLDDADASTLDIVAYSTAAGRLVTTGFDDPRIDPEFTLGSVVLIDPVSEGESALAWTHPANAVWNFYRDNYPVWDCMLFDPDWPWQGQAVVCDSCTNFNMGRPSGSIYPTSGEPVPVDDLDHCNVADASIPLVAQVLEEGRFTGPAAWTDAECGDLSAFMQTLWADFRTPEEHYGACCDASLRCIDDPDCVAYEQCLFDHCMYNDPTEACAETCDAALTDAAREAWDALWTCREEVESAH